MPSVSNTVDRRRTLPTAAFTLITVWIVLLVAVGGFRFVAWPRPNWQTWILGIMPTPEALLLFGILLLIGSAETRRGYWIPVSLFLGLLVVWNVGEVVYRWNYRDHFVLVDDLDDNTESISSDADFPQLTAIPGYTTPSALSNVFDVGDFRSDRDILVADFTSDGGGMT